MFNLMFEKLDVCMHACLHAFEDVQSHVREIRCMHACMFACFCVLYDCTIAMTGLWEDDGEIIDVVRGASV